MAKAERNVAIVGAGLIGRAWADWVCAGRFSDRSRPSNSMLPAEIPDYCARYTGFYKELAAAAAGPAVYESPNVEAVIAAWPHRPEAERIAALTKRRNERLAAHKTKQADKA